MTHPQDLVRPSDQQNRLLVENVHPPDWPTPMVSGRYNLVVIGGGTAGLVTAAGAAGLGAKVALIEKHLLGGDCLNYGCVPSKGLIRAARMAQAVREAASYGVHLPDKSVRVSFGDAMERMRRLRAAISEHDSAKRFRDLGIDVYLGAGRFVGPNAIEVAGQKLEFSRAVIATGARAGEPTVPGLAEAGFLTNETVFSLTELPPRLCVIGAGPIGCELAQAFRRFGSDVSILTEGERILPREDSDASRIIARQFEQEGIRIFPRAKILRADATPREKAVVFRTEDREERITCDAILVAVGRVPNTEGLNLEAARVAYDKKGVIVDDRLRTSNPNIYAAGDICSRFKFTHAADAMARLVLRNAFFFGRGKASDLIIPWCTFTDPEVAHVGLYEEEARRQGYEVVTYTTDMAENDRAVLDGSVNGFARVHTEKKSGKILGATLVSEHAGESIAEFALAMAHRVPVAGLSSVIHPYPTQAEAIKRLGDASMRARLTPFFKDLLLTYFKFRR